MTTVFCTFLCDRTVHVFHLASQLLTNERIRKRKSKARARHTGGCHRFMIGHLCLNLLSHGTRIGIHRTAQSECVVRLVVPNGILCRLSQFGGNQVVVETSTGTRCLHQIIQQHWNGNDCKTS